MCLAASSPSHKQFVAAGRSYDVDMGDVASRVPGYPISCCPIYYFYFFPPTRECFLKYVTFELNGRKSASFVQCGSIYARTYVPSSSETGSFEPSSDSNIGDLP